MWGKTTRSIEWERMSERKMQADQEESQEPERTGKTRENDGQAPESEPEVDLVQQVQQLEEDLEAARDQLLRKTADLENFRKRLLRDKEESIKYANAALLSDILPIIDDFERAIQSAADSKDFDAFHTGVSMIEKQMVSMLERNWGLKRFSANGEPFDPEKHEAIAVEETDKHDSEIVLEDYQKGYLLHDRILRPAKVKVARPIVPEEAGGEDEHDKE
jgi:molecular chaperone GrpE